MKHIKKFESYFVSDEDSNEILDKITKNGIESISLKDRNILKQYSEDDVDIKEIIKSLVESIVELEKVNIEIRSFNNEYDKVKNILKDKWKPLNDKISKLENSLISEFGILPEDSKIMKYVEDNFSESYQLFLDMYSI